MLRAALFFWALAALPVAAQEVGARLEARFDTWLEVIGTTGGLGYATLDGDVWATGGAKTPGELACVSKSATAMCACALVVEGALDWSDTVVERLGNGGRRVVDYKQELEEGCAPSVLFNVVIFEAGSSAR